MLFEICNVVGSAKTTHKLFAMYYLLGNLHSYARSCINPIQLVLLCREKYLNVDNMESFFQPFLKDLHLLETEGLDIGLGECIRGSVFATAGDNLGSRWIGGFLTNFSTSGYSCRYCLAQTCDFGTEMHATKPLRTVASYAAAVATVESSNQLHHEGIKFSSPFNTLTYFHVCNPGLPPCIGHNIFKGIAKYDLMLCLKYFIKKKWFTEAYLNLFYNFLMTP